ncbi:MAG: hypothetical protein VW268_14190 [Rhodospirillaceae bacterium]
MSDWLSRAEGFDVLDEPARKALRGLTPVSVPKGQVLFHPGDPVSAFVVVPDGRVDVFLTGAAEAD